MVHSGRLIWAGGLALAGLACGPAIAASETTLAGLTCLPNANAPYAGLVADPAGKLYGTSFAGGTRNIGTVFALTPPVKHKDSWTESVLYSFGSQTIPPPLVDATSPQGGLLRAKSGTLFGSGYYDNDTDCGGNGCGALFALVPPTGQNTLWHNTILSNFSGMPDGANPIGNLVNGVGGLYGVTQNGGTIGAGTVFKLAPPAAKGQAWTRTTIYNFANGADGGFPVAGLLASKGGILYGTAPFSGSLGAGTVFKMTPPAAGGTVWTETVLYTFGISGRQDDGDQPMGSLIADSSGALYGTSAFGGTAGRGTVFRLSPPAAGQSAWTETTLYSFANTGDGALPVAGLLLRQGILYGTTEGTGTAGSFGSVFSLAPPGGGGGTWNESTLYRFSGGADGRYPLSALVAAKGGLLAGTTLAGGARGCGVVFGVKP